MMSSQLVIGCSEQFPNQLRVYRLMGTSSDGGVLLSRHGANYSAAQGQVSNYGELLESMLGLVLAKLSPDLGARSRAVVVLTRRWNRDWGVEAEDLIAAEAGGDGGNAQLGDDERVDQAGLGSFPASDPPPWTFGRQWRPRPDSEDPDDPDGGESRDRARRRRHID